MLLDRRTAQFLVALFLIIVCMIGTRGLIIIFGIGMREIGRVSAIKKRGGEQLKAEILSRWKQLSPADRADLLKKMLE